MSCVVCISNSQLPDHLLHNVVICDLQLSLSYKLIIRSSAES